MGVSATRRQTDSWRSHDEDERVPGHRHDARPLRRFGPRRLGPLLPREPGRSTGASRLTRTDAGDRTKHPGAARPEPPHPHTQEKHMTIDTPAGKTIRHYRVSGMTCNHCASAVEREVGAIDGVTDVTVDLPTGAVVVASTRPIAHDEM